MQVDLTSLRIVETENNEFRIQHIRESGWCPYMGPFDSLSKAMESIDYIVEQNEYWDKDSKIKKIHWTGE